MNRSSAAAIVVAAAVVAVACVYAGVGVSGLNNGLARTPQMGWNSWNRFACSINETLIRATADAMVALGLPAAGYNYLNLDDCWASMARAANDTLQPDPVAFPSGLFALGDYIHSRGLRFGIYTDTGMATCQGRPGSFGYYDVDAATFAAWGVDYLKQDWCNVPLGFRPAELYHYMRDALAATGRPILFSMCEWGVDDPATWAPVVGNSWRTTGDIKANENSVLSNLDRNNRWAAYAGPGGWNDPDMLEVGNGQLTADEELAHFSFWCVIKSPLLIGNDLTNMPQSVLTILTNAEAIAVNQDTLGVQGRRIASTNDIENDTAVWAKAKAYAAAAPCDLTRSDQKWLYAADGTIRSYDDGLCLQLQGCSNGNGFNTASVAECTATCDDAGANLKWSRSGDTLVNTLSQQCLNQWDTYGPEVDVETCDGSASQNWALNATDNSIRAQGLCLSTTAVVPQGTVELWGGPLENGDWAVILFNRAAAAPVAITADFERIGLAARSAAVRDINAHKDLGVFTDSFTATVKPTAVMFLRLTPQ